MMMGSGFKCQWSGNWVTLLLCRSMLCCAVLSLGLGWLTQLSERAGVNHSDHRVAHNLL